MPDQQSNGSKAAATEVYNCANIGCPNKADQGTMVVVHLPITVAPGRTITLIMCGPCGRKMFEQYNRA